MLCNIRAQLICIRVLKFDMCRAVFIKMTGSFSRVLCGQIVAINFNVRKRSVLSLCCKIKFIWKAQNMPKILP